MGKKKETDVDKFINELEDDELVAIYVVSRKKTKKGTELRSLRARYPRNDEELEGVMGVLAEEHDSILDVLVKRNKVQVEEEQINNPPENMYG